MPKPKERSSINVQSERVVLAAVRLPDSRYDRTNPFGELRSLAEQAGSIVVGELTQNLDRPVAGTLPGEVQEKARQTQGVKDATLELVWDPPFSIDRIPEHIRLEMGLM